MSPVVYDSVWALGPCCASQYFLNHFPEFRGEYGPFTWLAFPGILDAVTALCTGFKDVMEKEDITYIRNKPMSTKSSVFLTHLFSFPGLIENGKDMVITSGRGLEIAFPKAKETLMRRLERLQKVMQDPEAHPLFIHALLPTGGGSWPELLEAGGEPDWRGSEEEAREALRRLREAFPAQSSLFYLRYSPGIERSVVDATYPNLVIASHPYGKDVYARVYSGGVAMRVKRDLGNVSDIFRRIGRKVMPPKLIGGKQVASPSFCERMRERVSPEVEGEVRAYLFLREAFPGADKALIRYFPLFFWGVLYAQEEGVKEVTVVTDVEHVRSVAMGLGCRVLTLSEYKEEDMSGVRYKISLCHAYPFHRVGMLREMLREAQEYTFVTAGNAGCMEVVNLDRVREGKWGEKEVPLSGVYAHRIVTMKDLRVAQHCAQWYNGEELLPNLVRSAVVVQNQHKWDRDYSAFIDSCDLVMRVNLMESRITGCYGKRCDMMIAGDSYELVYQRETRKRMYLEFPFIPLVYSLQGQIIRNGEFSYAYNISSLPKELGGAFFTTSLFGAHILVNAFPGAQVYTTGVKTLISFNAFLRHILFSQAWGEKIWGILLDRRKVIDVTREEGYGEKWEDEARKIVRLRAPGWSDLCIMNLHSRMCIRRQGQNLGVIEATGELEPGEWRITWLYAGKVERFLPTGEKDSCGYEVCKKI